MYGRSADWVCFKVFLQVVQQCLLMQNPVKKMYQCTMYRCTMYYYVGNDIRGHLMGCVLGMTAELSLKQRGLTWLCFTFALVFRLWSKLTVRFLASFSSASQWHVFLINCCRHRCHSCDKKARRPYLIFSVSCQSCWASAKASLCKTEQDQESACFFRCMFNN